MPAYRSEAEGNIRKAVIDRLRELVPGCRIINEINAASFGNRIDVLAVGTDKMVAVEIKSRKDKLDRLPDQVRAMRLVTPHAISALHDKFFETPVWWPEGKVAPKEAHRSTCWRFVDGEAPKDWELVRARQRKDYCLPPGALLMLWRQELHAICSGLGLKGVAKMTMEQAADEIRYRMTGEEINDCVFKTLRSRICVEADDAV